MNIAFFIWLTVGIIFLLLELGHPGLLLFLSFSLGAFASAGVSLFIDSVIVQALIFLLGASLSVLLFKLWIIRKAKMTKPAATNIYALRGKRGLVVRAIEPLAPGLVKIGGELWVAYAVNALTIEAGRTVEVVETAGAHVKVKPVD